MSARPVVKLYRNPWKATLSNEVVLQILQTAAVNAYERLNELIASGVVEEGRESYGMVILDPTWPRSATTFEDRLFASIELGPDAERFLPNACAKADAHDRHGVNNGELVYEANHCLGDDDFAYGFSAEYRNAIGGGSGLSEEQDRYLAESVLREVMDQVSTRRIAWLTERRREVGGRRWFNERDEPAAEYKAIAQMTALVPAST